MIPVNEFRNIASEQNPQYRVLKPWWDVFSEYLCIAMLMIGVFGCTVQLTQEKISCLPNRIVSSAKPDVDCSHVREHQSNESLWEYSVTKELKPNVLEVFGRKNGLDIHQYVFVNHYCYERAVHWYAKYFPYLVVIHSMIFMVASSFWFKFPGTSSKIELFVNILSKCFDSPWTTRAISEVSEERGEEKMVSLRKGSSINSASKINPDAFAAATGNHDVENVTLLRSASVVSNPDKKPSEASAAASVLDKKEGEQAKALFEKVKKFRTHVEEADLLYKMYVIQTSLKVFKFVLITAYTASLVPNIEIVIKCSVPPDLTGFDIFCCNNNKANLFSKLAYCYICFVGVYGSLCIYSLYWLFHRSLKEYSFEHVRLETGINDIPDMKNDFAFLLHLSDRYDPLYAKRFAVFLSEVSESRLRQVNLNHEWTTKKLRARLTRNASQLQELHLFMLAGLPDTVFEIPEVESIKMELLGNVTIPATLTQLTELTELSLVHCPAKLQLAALRHLQEHLKVLWLTFETAEEVPLWMYTLKALEELHLIGPIGQEASRVPLDTLRELKNLRVLTLRGHLTKLPASVVDVATQLQRLCVHNEGCKLQVLSSVKKLSSLASLELTGCQLERIPSAVFSLTGLQELDLRDNKLTTVEEILSLQHCRRLTTLRLWHNSIAYIPEHVGKLHALETLDASWNKIRRLPSRLYYCTKLRHLDVSHNQLSSLPAEIGSMQSLQYLSVAFNTLESLPEELFSCKRLKTLALGNNSISFISSRVSNLAQLVRLELKGNRLESLPVEIGDCTLLKLSGIVVEQSLLELLPSEVRDKMDDS